MTNYSLPSLPPLDTGMEISRGLPPFVEDLISIGLIAMLFALIYWISKKTKYHAQVVRWMQRLVIITISGIFILHVIRVQSDSVGGLLILFIIAGITGWAMWDTHKTM